MEWGLLGGERLGGTRRVRTLGLAATVRAFNELAVPGLGGVWFGKQVVLALLGIHLAESSGGGRRGTSNITTANAVEALAVWFAYNKHDWNRDARLPGFRKLRRQDPGQDPSFRIAGNGAFYVSQPMRVGTRDALAMLGLVNAPNRRFNTYTCTPRGLDLLGAACPESRSLLPSWVSGGSLPVQRKSIVEELDPTHPLPNGAREILREMYMSGTKAERARRRQALDWVESLRAHGNGHTDWDRTPPEIADPRHWADMRAGAAFTSVVAAAVGEIEIGSVLGHVEARMGAAGVRKRAVANIMDAALRLAIDELRRRAQAFLDAEYDPSPGRAASRFCEECTQPDEVLVLSNLITRDNRILRLVDDNILAGPAFQGQPVRVTEAADDAIEHDEEGTTHDAPLSDSFPSLPDGISARIRNLAFLAQDLRVAPVAASGI